MATSTSPLASPTVGSLHETCRNSSFHPGSRVAIRAVTPAVRPRPILVWKPTVTVIRPAVTTWEISHCAASHCWMISRACGSSAAPAAVNATERWSRSNSVTRRRVSNWRICLLNDGWAMNSRLAALVKLSSSATATK